MSREIKHVSINFNHPLNNVWPGYINEHWKECDACNGRGTTKAMEYLAERTRSLVWNIDRLKGKDLDEITELTTGLCGRPPSLGLLGHDSIDEWRARDVIVKAAGLDPKTWGVCPICNGEGIDPAVLEAYSAWERTEPPTGDGLQIWETVTEGSPISPVFPNAEALIEWLVAKWRSESAARVFAKDEWAPFGVMTVTEYKSNIDALDLTEGN